MSQLTPTYYRTASDEELMRHFIQNQDQQAFDQVYQRYFVPISKYISWLSNDTAIGKDIAQSIFLKLLHRPSIFDPNRSLKTWLFSVANNQWKNEKRNRSTQLKHQQYLSQEMSKQNQEEEPKDNKQRLAQVHLALENLGELHREAMVLKYSNNLSIKEISEVLQCSEGTVKSRLFYALQHLKKQLVKSKEI